MYRCLFDIASYGFIRMPPVGLNEGLAKRFH